MIIKKYATVWKKFCATPSSPWPGCLWFLSCLVFFLLIWPNTPALVLAGDICGYSNPVYSEYNRLLKVEVNRGGQKVGEVHYSAQFDGYYVRCTTGGIPKKRFFARARDARWAACGSCY